MDPTSQHQIQFPMIWAKKAIIAMKGLPSTGKSEIAEKIGRWARCQVCYIDDFLETVCLATGYTPEEADRLHCLAFDALCRAALRHLHLSNCVVIKSRLCSTFELDLLIRLASDIYCYGDTRIIIIVIDCQIKNDYRWQSRLGLRPNLGQKYAWYKARSWKDVEKARDDEVCLDSQAWDLHLLSSLDSNPISSPCRVTRLVLDPFCDLNISSDSTTINNLTLDFLDAVKYLLIDQEDLDIRKLALHKGGYKALQYDELRRDLLEMELRTPRERGKYLCSSKTSKAGSCLFEYREKLYNAEGSCCCGACGVRVGSDQPAYTCHFCILTLHKSCAEKPDFDFGNHEHLSNLFFNIAQHKIELSRQGERHACKSCMEGGKCFTNWCESCHFETQLKCGRLPTIINHDCHQLHFLSIQFSYKENSCKACGMSICELGKYVCHICNFTYHTECVFLPVEVTHGHGGYEHVMKLLHSHDFTEPEDENWCNGCYKDMDPQAWFYSCQYCPYYVTHASLRCVGHNIIQEAVHSGHIPIQLLRQKYIKKKIEEKKKRAGDRERQTQG